MIALFRICLLVLLSALVPAAEPVASKAPHFVLVGDSTVTEGSGWGLGFRQFLRDDVTCSNTAQNGRSSRSFIAEGHWQKALALKGDYYLIQFGHNDQPGKGPERETDPATTYTANLVRFVDDVRAIGATPILVTSLTRRHFSRTDPARIDSTLTPYAEAVKKVAAAKKVLLIDLHARSIALCESLGRVECSRLNPSRPDGLPDTTHLDATGSAVFALLVVEELRRRVPALAPLLLSGPRSAKVTDIEYGQAAGEKLMLDVNVPGGNGTFPVAILVHGGGWTSGDKATDITPWFESLTEAQFTWFSINYRLAPKHRWPACFEDVQTAIRWVKANAARYKGDPSRIALIGYSAGGQLATLAATVVDESVRVQAVVGYAPPTDFVQELPMRGGVLSRVQQGLLNRPQGLTPESIGMLAALSPINHVRPGLPPLLLLHGDADKTVPLQQSLNFQAKLRANFVRCDLITLPGAPHRLTEWDKFMPDHGARMVAWLREVLAVPRPKPAALRSENGLEPR